MNKLILNLPTKWIDYYIKYKSKNPKNLVNLILNSDPDLLEEINKKKALFIFKKTIKDVNFYRNYIESKNIDFNKVINIEDFIKLIPSIDKDGYIRKAKHIHDLCFPKHKKRAELLVRSSGFTGKPQTWIESKEEIDNSKKYVSFGLDILYNTKKYSTLIINGFALGSWVSGISLLREVEDECSIINPGLVENEILDLVKQFKNEYEQIIVAGNPVFLKNLIDEGIKKRLNWYENRIHIMTAGESITEGWRDYLQSKLNKESKIYSVFGASDIGVIGINETENSVKIRKLTLKNLKLKKALFNHEDVTPMLFQYDPMKFFITTNNKGELEFTTCGLDIATPLIKYNLHDIGGTITYNNMKYTLLKFKIDMEIKLPFPFIYIVGRSDGVISFCSSNIYPSNIQQAIYSNKKLSSYSTGKFKLSKKYDKNHNSYIHIDIQLEKDKKPSKKLRDLFEKSIYNSFEKNSDFKDSLQQLDKKKKKFIDIKIHKYNNFKSDLSIKQRYIV